MNYFCGNINYRGENNIWHNHIIKYNPHLGKINDFILPDFQMVTYCVNYKAYSDTIVDMFHDDMCFMYIEGYIFFNGLCVTGKSDYVEKEILFDSLSEIIGKQEYFRLNDLGGSFLVLMRYANKNLCN